MYVTRSSVQDKVELVVNHHLYKMQDIKERKAILDIPLSWQLVTEKIQDVVFHIP